jgi:hypothetical protein
MLPLTRVGDRFNEPIKIVGGPKTVGRIQRSDGGEPGAEFALPKTNLRVNRRSLIRAGQVVQAPGGDHFLVAEHSETGEYRTHHLFPTDRRVEWTRQTVKIHPVSKQQVGSGKEELGTLWVMWERTRREFMDLSIRIAQENYLIATGADVQLGDYIDGKLVKRVNHALGVRILELQG